MKKYIIISGLILCSIVSRATKHDSTFFKHQTGAGVSIYLLPPPDYALFNGNLNYNVRYHFKILSATSSLSANINTGIAIRNLYIYGINISRFFQFNIPVTINYNLGNGASKNSTQSSGTYAGAGACIDMAFLNYKGKTYPLSIGPIINAGFRFGQSNDGNGHAKYDLKFSYLTTLNKNGKGLSDIFTVTMYYSF